MENKKTQNTQSQNTENKKYNFNEVCKMESNKLFYKCITADPDKPIEDVVIDVVKATHLENKVDKPFNTQFVASANKKIIDCVEQLNDIENYVDVDTRDDNDKPLTVTLKKKNSISNFTGRNNNRITLLSIITKLLNGDAISNNDEKFLTSLTAIERGTPFIIYKGMSLAEMLQKNAKAKKSFDEINDIAAKKGLKINMVTMMVE